MVRIIYLAILAFTFGSNQVCFAQTFKSPYTLSWKLDAPLAIGGLGLNTIYLFLDQKTKPLDLQQLSLLDRSRIVQLDRSASFNWSKSAAHASDVVFIGSLVAPSFLSLSPTIRKDFTKVGNIWAQTFFITAGITNMTKVLIKRTRPYAYNSQVPMHERIKRDARYSFFSGHTSMTASMTFMSAKIFNDYHPKHKALPYIWTSAVLLPATTAFFRWRAGKHFFTDVIIGYIVGAGIGILVPHLHKIIH